jgi:hypothetical protein
MREAGRVPLVATGHNHGRVGGSASQKLEEGMAPVPIQHFSCGTVGNGHAVWAVLIE